jgi:bifunctional DNA-binding transcriptional regulator/antitoxin component of YhaV-PrlF toxin-antitoxin module
MSDPVAVSTIGPSQLGAEIARRLRLKEDEPVLLVEGSDFVLVKRAPTESPLERFRALTAETHKRVQVAGLTPDMVDEAIRWARGSS